MNWEYLGACVLAYSIKGITTTVFYLIHNVLHLDVDSGMLDSNITRKPARSLYIPTTSARKVKIDIYEPQNPFNGSAEGEQGGQKPPRPVHVNFHGSGFMMKLHGVDAEFCAYLANTLQCTVIDADYAKAPRRPFPAAVDDALDILAYVASQPEMYDLSKVTVGGFSASRNIALLVATRLDRDG